MADDEKEKAEKLAAAKKRFEQLKKEQKKKDKKSAGKKKDAKVEDNAVDDAAIEDTSEAAATADQVGENNDDGAEDDGDKDADASDTRPSKPSKPRSESFRSPQAEVQELYRKQAAKIEELEKENKTLKQQTDDDSAQLQKLGSELETLREGSSDVAEARSRAKEADRLTGELASVQRQLAQAQQAAKTPARKSSGAHPDLSEQLASKTSTIESLELETSNLRHQVAGLENSISERDATARDLEERAKTAEAATDAIKQELDALKVSIAFPSDETKAANEDPEALTKRITVLESDVRTANNNLDAAAKRATSLEQKIEALTKLHREATTASQTKDRELSDLRAQLKRRDRPSHVRDASDFELGEEETETGALQARIRALEAENFDLRRGVWRDQRAAMQPGMDDDQAAVEYEDVDLNGPYSAGARARGSTTARHSTLQDVITSGITAFTGRTREATKGGTAHERKQSLGLLSEDGFDEDAFRLAQEEEASRRIERVKEVKRGLDQWQGWRIDIAELRKNGIGWGREVGPVFEV